MGLKKRLIIQGRINRRYSDKRTEEQRNKRTVCFHVSLFLSFSVSVSMLTAIIPAYNEEKTLGGVLEKVKLFVDKIIVVNDGSNDKTAEIAKQYGAQVLNHIINRGLGAALRTGFVAALGLRNLKVAATDLKNNDAGAAADSKNNDVASDLRNDLKNNDVAAGFSLRNEESLDIILTLDADGQHSAEDIPRLIAPIQNGEADVVLGSRFTSFVTPAKAGVQKNDPVDSRVHRQGGASKPENDKMGNAPLFRSIANFLGNVVTFFLFGIWVSDSQSGFRAFSGEALSKINLKSSGMEVSSEIIKEIKRNNLRLKEIPIKPVYTKYSMSKGQNFLEGIKTVSQLILRKIDHD